MTVTGLAQSIARASPSVEATRVNVNAHTKQGFRDALGVMRYEADQRGLEGFEREAFYAESISWMEENVRSLLSKSKYVGRLLSFYAFISHGFTRVCHPGNDALIKACTIEPGNDSPGLKAPSLRTLCAAKASIFTAGALLEIPWSTKPGQSPNVANPYKLNDGRSSKDVRLAECKSWTHVVALLATDGEPADGSIGQLLAQRYADQSISREINAKLMPPLRLVEAPPEKLEEVEVEDKPAVKPSEKPTKNPSGAGNPKADERVASAYAAFAEEQGSILPWGHNDKKAMKEIINLHGVEDTLNAIRWLHRHWSEYSWLDDGTMPNPSLMRHISDKVFRDMRSGRAPKAARGTVISLDEKRRSRVQKSEWVENATTSSALDLGLD